MATFERISSGAKQVGWRSVVGRAVLGLTLVPPLAACEKTIGLEGFGGTQGSNAPDYSLSVNCAANPDDSQTLGVIQTREVHTVGLSVNGQDQWRLQILPAHSDLTVFRSDGSSTLSTIEPGGLETGHQQWVKLPHGALGVRQTTDRETLPAMTSGASPPETPVDGPQLELTLDCQAPPVQTPSAAPRQQ